MTLWGWFFLAVFILGMLAIALFLYLSVKGGQAEGFLPQDDDK